MSFFQKILDGADLLFAGMMGAIVALAVNTEIRTLKQRVYFIVSGSVSSYYLADPVNAYFHLTDGNFRTAMGFLVGIFGAAVLQAITRAVKAADLWEFVKNRFGGGNPTP